MVFVSAERQYKFPDERFGKTDSVFVFLTISDMRSVEGWEVPADEIWPIVHGQFRWHHVSAAYQRF